MLAVEQGMKVAVLIQHVSRGMGASADALVDRSAPKLFVSGSLVGRHLTTISVADPLFSPPAS